jgi:hypothetical protein
LATKFTITLKGFFSFIHCILMLTQAFTDLWSNAAAFYLNNSSMVLIYFFMFQVSIYPTSTSTWTMQTRNISQHWPSFPQWSLHIECLGLMPCLLTYFLLFIFACRRSYSVPFWFCCGW